MAGTETVSESQVTAKGVASIAVPATVSSAQAELRERFLADPDDTDLSTLRPVIARSWRRSVAWKADLDPTTARAIRDPEIDQRLIDSAEPAIRVLLRATREREGCVIVADRFGTIATVRGARAALRWAERSLGVPGVALAEDVIGTNCVGTAIEEQQGVTIAGAEHLSGHLQGCWSSSVLLRDPLRRSVRGVLSLALPLEAAEGLNADGLGALVDRAAAEVMDVLAARLAAREQALLTSYLRQLRKRGSGAVMAIDGRTTIANHGALELVGAREQLVLAAYAQEAQRDGRAMHRELSLDNGSTVDVHIEPVVSGGEAVGSVLDLRAADGAATPQRSGTRAKRPDPFAGLVGESPAFVRAMELAQRAVERATPAHIVGETGTGKRALAMAIARACGDDVLCLDAQSMPDGNGLAEVAPVFDRDGAVVLRRADALPGTAWSDLAALVQARPRGRLVVTARRLPDAAMAFVRAIGSIEIEMPALRARRDDVPSLVSAFLADAAQAPRRVSSRLLKALIEAELPGNVAQLREIVATGALRCSTTELTTDDLTAEDRQALMRTTLSPLQIAEVTQIREALREAHGNRVRAAEILRIGRSTLYRRLDMYTRLGFEL